MSELTAEQLRELLDYNPETGVFSWRVPRRGAKTGSLRPDGYRHICIAGRHRLAHRLAWLYVYGRWPVNQIDHINGVRDDNRICNLREATFSENHQNRAVQRNNTSGYTGVSWDIQKKAWQANIQIGRRQRNLGRFATLDAARAAYLAAKAELHTFQPTPREAVAR